jgi:peptidyl-prolyl cis-trans isomerase A (cyclophilin A)
MSRPSFTLSIALALLVAVPAVAFPQAAARPNVRVPATLKEKAPDTYKARFDTSAGAFVIEVHRAWAPTGADRFYNLVKNGFYDDCRFFRVLPGFMVQFGINGNPTIQSAWNTATIPDDPVKESNKRGFVTFAKAPMPNSRSTQVFINFGNNARLDQDGFAPFGRVVSGMDVVDKIYGGYGEGAPNGNGPDQSLVRTQGNRYLTKDFPKLDYVRKATIEQ